jgi:hypothetical protein
MTSKQLMQYLIFITAGVVSGCATQPQSSLQTPQPPAGVGFPFTADYFSAHGPEVGTTTIRLCMTSSGQLARLPSLVKTSGDAQLDEGAIIVLVANSRDWLFRRPDEGPPGNACAIVRAQFTMGKPREGRVSELLTIDCEKSPQKIESQTASTGGCEWIGVRRGH